ncbi:MAG: DUF1553 domain-containing protein [Planctomycetota bacterium]
MNGWKSVMSIGKSSVNFRQQGWVGKSGSGLPQSMVFDFALVCGLMMGVSCAAETSLAAKLEFFETRIRPVLVEQCYSCHNTAKTQDGGLALDDRASLLKGGDEGVIVVAGKPEASKLIPILRHEVKGTLMPKKGGKLDERIVADFEKWIADGAVDPRDKPPSATELANATSWETMLEKRKKWWSFQPIKAATPLVLPENKWSDHPVDRFIFSKLHEKGLEPNAGADARTLVRRTFFALIGLPPSAEEAETWSARLTQRNGFEALVDHLLASSHFGERWARHWMDWIRYAESHGSEGDPGIDNAFMYRDYLIRALNADVPYDQLVREHIVGDLMKSPRINKEQGINESAIGPAHWRMVFHGFAPTDALEEKTRFIDDEINTFSKAFLGLTVSCAKCHDHKFDAISQKDYYALYGIFASCRPGRTVITSPEKLNANRAELAALKPKIRAALADVWTDAAGKLADDLKSDKGAWTKAEKPGDVLHPIFKLHKEGVDDAHFNAGWQRRDAEWKAERKQREEFAQRAVYKRWDLAREADAATWYRAGNGLAEKPSRAGEFALASSGANALTAIFPGGVYSNLISAKSPARLSSGLVHLGGDYEVWMNVIGDGTSAARYVVQDYPRNGTVYPEAKTQKEWHWQRFDATYWNGDDLHLEITAGKDAPVLVNNEARSWFGIRGAAIIKKGEGGPPVAPREFFDPIFEAAEKTPPKLFADLNTLYTTSLNTAILAWKSGAMSDAQALFLDACLKQNVLPNQVDKLGPAQALIAEYRDLDEALVVPTRVPGLEETAGRNHPLLVRGNHKTPGDMVPRRFLEAIDAKPYETSLSGREQLADNVLRDDNPLTRRVIVNRLWHHLFGRGIVASPDNFGKLGFEPTHPELLDFLATRFKEKNWSLKETIRFIVTSKTWQMSSHPSTKAAQLDPDNSLLSHAFVRRLEAEAIRDELLAVSGSLNADLYGAPSDGNSVRRSVYVAVRRNALDPFLRVFDFPEPFTTVGRRDATNVPAQSLTLMNDEHVASLASAWAGRVLSDTKLTTDDARISGMFMTALSRPALSGEIVRIKTYLVEAKSGQSAAAVKYSELRKQIDELNNALRKVVDPIRAKLEVDLAGKPKATADQNLPKPFAHWDFKSDLKDVIGSAHGSAKNGARSENGALVVKNKAHVVTTPLSKTITEKTLEAWVQLDTLDQRGGGVMTIETPTGAVFDSIVFAEKDPHQWLAGSNNFKRTQSFAGPTEKDASSRPIHLAIAYHADGQIAMYRDGSPYGTAYKSDGPVEFKAGEAVVGFGNRHLPGGANSFLSGRILRANLYDRALSADEIRATSGSTAAYVSDAQILAALSETDRKHVAELKAQISALESEMSKLGPLPDGMSDKAVWTDVARAMFTFKEFIYIK